MLTLPAERRKRKERVACPTPSIAISVARWDWPGNRVTWRNKGERDRNDERCAVLYAKMQESAQTILALGEREMDGHKAKGKWD